MFYSLGGSIEDIGNRKINLAYGLCGPPDQFGKLDDSPRVAAGISSSKFLELRLRTYDTIKQINHRCE